MNIQEVYTKGKEVFYRDKLKTKKQRIKALNSLKKAMRAKEGDMIKALFKDLNKSPYEGFMTEIGLIYGEIEMMKKNLGGWMEPEKIRPSLAQRPAKIKVMKEPYGCVLVISPWNYPFYLSLNPVINALAAGNTVVVKPSNYSSHSSQVIQEILEMAFPDGEVQVVLGGREENQELLDQPFDYIFFTGSPKLGKIVMEKAAAHLTPVTLELGGKSPVIVDHTANIKKAAKRILFGKLLNGGQTCIAPDHVYVEEEIKEEFLSELICQVEEIYKNPIYVSRVLPRMISKKHFDRVRSLIDEDSIIYGGKTNRDDLYIEFTILEEPSLSHTVMKEEIFGPVLPVLGFKNLDELILDLQDRPKPLALYLFTKSRKNRNKVLDKISFGGGCVNDTVLHVTNSKAPFGGVGNSGMGNYHGEYGFNTFTHKKTVLKKSWLFDIPLRHHPYKKPSKKLPKFLFH